MRAFVSYYCFSSIRCNSESNAIVINPRVFGIICIFESKILFLWISLSVNKLIELDSTQQIPEGYAEIVDFQYG